MMGSLSAVTWVVFGVWMAAGLAFYFSYGYRRSLSRALRSETPAVLTISTNASCTPSPGYARRSYADIGHLVGLSAPAVKCRVDRLRATVLITGFTVRVDPAALGWETEGFVEIDRRRNTSPETIQRGLERYQEVVAASTVTGEADAVVQVFASTCGISSGCWSGSLGSRSLSGPSRCWCCLRCCGGSRQGRPREGGLGGG